MKRPGRIMGLDVGEARTGVALSDPLQCVATPHSVIQVKQPEADIAEISRIIEEHGVVGIVVGLPYNLKGEIGPQAEKVLRFVDCLRDLVNLDIEMQDERMSTASSLRMLSEANVKAKRRKQVIDKIAATQILQTWLDKADYQRRSEA